MIKTSKTTTSTFFGKEKEQKLKDLDIWEIIPLLKKKKKKALLTKYYKLLSWVYHISHPACMASEENLPRDQ